MQLPVDGLLKTRKAALKKLLPVYEDCRRSLDIGLTAAFEVPFDQGRYGLILQVAAELLHVESEAPSDFIHLGVAQFVLIREELAVHLRKLPLSRSSEGRRGGFSGELMRRQREINGDEFDFLRIFLQHLLKEGFKPLAVRSLIVIEDGHGHRSICRSPERQAAQVDVINGREHHYLDGLPGAARNGEPIREG